MVTDLLEVSFSKKEVHKEFMGADGNKAPGPDGFSFKFFQSFWSNFKGDVLPLFNQFLRQPNLIISSHHHSSR